MNDYLDDFINNGLIITITKDEVYLLKEFQDLLGNIRFASGASVNSEWFINLVNNAYNVYVVCISKQIYYGNISSSDKQVCISLTELVNKRSLNINETDFDNMFAR